MKKLLLLFWLISLIGIPWVFNHINVWLSFGLLILMIIFTIKTFKK